MHHLSPSHLTSYAEVLIWAMRTSRAVPFHNSSGKRRTSDKNGQFLV